MKRLIFILPAIVVFFCSGNMLKNKLISSCLTPVKQAKEFDRYQPGLYLLNAPVKDQSNLTFRFKAVRKLKGLDRSYTGISVLYSTFSHSGFQYLQSGFSEFFFSSNLFVDENRGPPAMV
ncbi:MAG TPA: hypothetical protein VK177_12100 [Flavobacteriales bacterium]|nr:hypothetical protein [Flavobacteriales bacterium]